MIWIDSTNESSFQILVRLLFPFRSFCSIRLQWFWQWTNLIIFYCFGSRKNGLSKRQIPKQKTNLNEKHCWFSHSLAAYLFQFFGKILQPIFDNIFKLRNNKFASSLRMPVVHVNISFDLLWNRTKRWRFFELQFSNFVALIFKQIISFSPGFDSTDKSTIRLNTLNVFVFISLNILSLSIIGTTFNEISSEMTENGRSDNAVFLKKNLSINENPLNKHSFSRRSEPKISNSLSANSQKSKNWLTETCVTRSWCCFLTLVFDA